MKTSQSLYIAAVSVEENLKELNSVISCSRMKTDVLGGRLVMGHLALLLGFMGCVTMEGVVTSDRLNVCIDSKNHKSEPGPETALFDKCSPWTNRSCCTESITKDLHASPAWYNFNWNHCPELLSTACRGHFIQDLCFYECSPNVGPWAVQVNQTFRKERFQHVPLCQSECSSWFNDCKEDYTCTKNWGKDFSWETGTNKCPLGSSCKKFKDVYNDSIEFCETIWDYSWKVVPQSEPCMVLWFDKNSENPNDRVAALKVGSGADHIDFSHLTYLVLVLLSVCLQIV
ncbi:hypothetical protein ScPMuIL_010222 [Solemya velum]